MTEDEVYQRYLSELDSLKQFEYSRRGQASRQNFSRGRGRTKAPDSWTARLLRVMGEMARQHRTLLDVALAVVRAVNPHSSVAEWQAKKFEAARIVLLGEYDDVELRSGPDPGRYKPRPYTRREKFIVLEVLRTFDDDSVPGLGWCAERYANSETGLMRELGALGVRIPPASASTKQQGRVSP